MPYADCLLSFSTFAYCFLLFFGMLYAHRSLVAAGAPVGHVWGGAGASGWSGGPARGWPHFLKFQMMMQQQRI
jgi:hypothetical protein